MSNNNSNRRNQQANQQNPPILNEEKTPAQQKREELESLSDSELDERWKLVFATETGPEMEREAVIEAIIANSPTPPPAALPVKDDKKGKYFVDKKGRQHFISDNAKGKVVVLLNSVTELNGSMVDVPNTENVQVFSKSVWNRLNENNFFGESKLQVEELQGA